MLVTINIYGVRFTQQIRYALITYNRSRWQTLFAFIICCLPFALIVFSSLFFNVIATIIVKSIVFLLLPFILLGWTLFSYNSLDKAINAQFYPELVGKGTYVPEYKDDSSWMNY